MKNKLKGVLWDLDGVLVETGEFHFQSWVETLKPYNIPLSREFFTSTFGMNNQGLLTRLLGSSATPTLIATISEQKEAAFRAAVRGRAKLLPGVLDTLTKFQDMGIFQAVASSAPQANVDVLLDELEIRPFFQAIVSGADLPGKPDPATFLRAARSIGVLPENCLVIEDAIVGVEAAHRAGMLCVAVTTTNPPEALQMAEIVIDRLDHLPKNFRSMLFSD
jgi:beta-phosphoglucomutase